jgi:DNA polymerase
LRIHKKPNAKEIAACRPWLDAEIARVRPKVIVCLGATECARPAQALISRTFRVSTQRGVLIESALAPLIGATVHPSSICELRTRSQGIEKCGSSSMISKIAHHLPLSALARKP